MSTERDQRPEVGRIGFAHGNKRDVVSRETGLNLQEGDFVSDFENDSVRVFGKGGPRGEGPSTSGLSRCMDNLCCDASQAQITSNNDEVVQCRVVGAGANAYPRACVSRAALSSPRSRGTAVLRKIR